MAIQKRFIHFKKFSDFNSKKLSANEANTQYTVGISGAIQNGEPDILYGSYVWIKDTQQQWTHGQLYDGSTNSVESNVYYTEFTADDVYWTYMTEGSPAPLTITQELLDAINAEKIIIVSSGLYRGSYIMQVGALDQETTRVTFIGSTDLIYCDMLNTNFILGNTIDLIAAGRRCSTMFEPSTTDTEGNTIVKRDSKGSIYAASYKGPTKAWNMPDATNVASDEGQLQAKLVNGTTIKKINNRNILGSGNITVQDTLVSGTNIKTVNGQSILGSGNLNTDNRVVLEFSTCDLEDLIAGNISAISIDPQSLETNIINNVPMIIPYSEEEGYRGYYTVTGYMEDLVYLTIVAGASVYYIEHGIGNYNITAQEVHRYAISEMQDLVQNINADLANLYDTKQDLLVSGNNIKTINGQSILGSGDIVITGGGIQAVATGDVLDDVTVNYATKTYVDDKVANISLTDYATTAYVNGLVGDINSILESIINGGGNAIMTIINGVSAVDIANTLINTYGAIGSLDNPNPINENIIFSGFTSGVTENQKCEYIYINSGLNTIYLYGADYSSTLYCVRISLVDGDPYYGLPQIYMYD